MAQTDATAPNLAVLKGITLGLGVLLTGGIALLGVLIARGDGDEAVNTTANRYLLDLEGSDRLEDVEVDQAGVTLTVERADGKLSVITTSRQTGVVTEVVLPAGSL